MRSHLRISYNAPITLTFSLLAILVMFLSILTKGQIICFFSTPNPINFSNPLSYFRIFSHVLGHKSWSHLFSNLSLMLLLGPLLEEKYGSKAILQLICLVALVTGVMHALFFNANLLGASGVVFAFIIISSLTNFRQGKIPLTFLLVAILFLGKEIFEIFANDNISQFSHIVGGICGGFYGDLIRPRN